jgi:hypothetical protein
MKLLKAENRGGGIRNDLATIIAELREYADIEKQSRLALDGGLERFSLKHEPEATRQARHSPVGPVTKDGLEYQETYLIQRLRPQKCTECGKVCTSLGRLNSHKTERLHKCR